MSTLTLTNASSGAPALSGTNGALNAVLDWALPQKGWAIEYTGTNARVYRAAAGNRHRLYVAHNSSVSGVATLATVRGCENASSVSDLVDPFPTVAQQANGSSSVAVSSAASALARPYIIVLTDRFLLMAIATTGANNAGWDLFLFGDLAADPADTYATICLVGTTSSTAATARSMANVMAGGLTATKVYWCRSIDGATKSTTGCLNGPSATPNTSFCSVAGSPVMRAGYGNRIVREKVAATCMGAAAGSAGALAMYKRGWVPNLWNPIHIGIDTITSDDVFTDSAYDVDSLFVIAPASTGVACIVEISDTWAPPNG